MLCVVTLEVLEVEQHQGERSAALRRAEFQLQVQEPMRAVGQAGSSIGKSGGVAGTVTYLAAQPFREPARTKGNEDEKHDDRQQQLRYRPADGLCDSICNGQDRHARGQRRGRTTPAAVVGKQECGQDRHQPKQCLVVLEGFRHPERTCNRHGQRR